MCRICGERTNKNKITKKGPPRLCKHYSKGLLFLSIDTEAEPDDVYSSTLCATCSLDVSRASTGITSPDKLRLQKEKEMEASKHIWTKFDPVLDVARCPTCSQFATQGKGGRPFKRKTGARNRILKDQNSSRDNGVQKDLSTPGKVARLTISSDEETQRRCSDDR